VPSAPVSPLPEPPGKRAFDVAVAAAGLVLLSPLLAGIALLIRAVMGPPVLFTQLRPGLGGSLFALRKFRTMRLASSADTPDDARLTALGRRLRATSLDELPELWNVLCGDMSLVGPRPLLAEYLPLYTPAQARRHQVRPGITGWAQINGRNALSWEEKFALDIWYVEHRSFVLDLRILALTVARVARCRDVAAPGEATMPRFRGSAPGAEAR
jgi:lipopolysaccharide/colanic/teichoic acid biosynthesis glycosyltransferase